MLLSDELSLDSWRRPEGSRPLGTRMGRVLLHGGTRSTRGDKVKSDTRYEAVSFDSLFGRISRIVKVEIFSDF